MVVVLEARTSRGLMQSAEAQRRYFVAAIGHILSPGSTIAAVLSGIVNHGQPLIYFTTVTATPFSSL